MKLINYWRLIVGVIPPDVLQSLGVTPWGIIAAIPPEDGTQQSFCLWDLGDGTVAFGAGSTCTNDGPFFSSRPYFGQPHGIITLAEFGTSKWERTIGNEEKFRLVPTGDGQVALYSLSEGRPDSGNGGVEPTHCEGYLGLVSDHPAFLSSPRKEWLGGGFGDDLQNAAWFTVVSSWNPPRPVFLDLLEVNQSGLGVLITEDLSGMDFTGRTIKDLDLHQAKSIQSCNFTNANLARANFSGRTDFEGVKFTGANMSSANFEGCDLRSANLSNVDLTGANLRGAYLPTQQALSGVCFAKADLRGSYLTGVDFKGADLTGAVLTGSNNTGCKFGGANLTGTDLSGMSFGEKSLSELQHPTDPTQPTRLSGSTFYFADIGLDWSCLDLTKAKIIALPQDLMNLNAFGARLDGMVLDNFRLDGAVFADASLSQASFVGTHMHKVNFGGTRLDSAVFTRAVLDECMFSGAAMGGLSREVAPNLSWAYIANCDFTGCNLYGVSFANATIIGNNVFGHAANLQETNFAGAYLANANLNGANLQGAHFDGAFMVQCVLDSADLSPTRDGSVRASLTNACLQGATFDGVNFDGADLSNAAITADAGKIMQQYFDQGGHLIPVSPIEYAGAPLPSATSFSSQTICPNGLTFKTNKDSGIPLAQMMEGLHAPTSWKPAGAQTEPVLKDKNKS